MTPTGTGPLTRPGPGARTGPDPRPVPDSGPGDGAEPPPAPLDLRLVPPALAAWAAAAVALAIPARWALSGAAAAVGLAVVLIGLRRPGLPRLAAAALVCASASAVVASAHAADLRRGPLPEAARDGGRVAVELTVTSDPRSRSPRVRGAVQGPRLVMVEATAEQVTGGGRTTRVRNPVLVIAQGRHSGRWLPLLPSTRVSVRAEAAPPQGSGDPIAAVLHVRDPPVLVRGPTRVQRTAGRLRAGLREAADGQSADARALLPGLVVGDTSRIPPGLAEDFRATDLSHLLAVSGANLTVLLVVLIGPPSRAIRAERGGLAPRLGLPLRVTALLGGLLTLGFVVLCRPEPSVLRAAACGLITLIAIGTGRRRAMVPALASAVLLLVLSVPELARSYGFLLSVLATGALLVIAPRWSGALRRRGVPGRLAEVLAAAAAAQAVCAPVVAVLAAKVSLVAVPCNLLAEPAVASATVLGFMALAAAPVAMPVAEGLAWIAAWPAEWIASVARTGAALPGAGMRWPGGWRGGLLLAVAVVIVVPLARRVLRRPAACAALVLVLLLVVLRPAPFTRVVTGWPPAGWRLVACDVGQGDALVLSAGGGSAVVVDTGPDPRAVDGCLRELGVTEVPLLVLSHFHADHVAGLPGVLRGRDVGAVQVSGLPLPADQHAMVRRTAGAARIPVIPAVPGERRSLGGLSWEVLWPTGDAVAAAGADAEPNDASVVLLVRVAGLTVLLLGDLEPPAQERLLTNLQGLPPVDVLKVAHHGSAYQDRDLLRRIGPRLAVISVGRDNPYGHPSPRTVGDLRSAGVTVLRTDTDGAVAVLGDRTSLRVASKGTLAKDPF